MARSRILMIIPTLGTRIDFLSQALQSISSQDTQADIVVVCPREATEATYIAHQHHAIVIDDPGTLPKAINAGATQLREHHEFIAWLGDDDLLEPQSLTTTTTTLDNHQEATVAFGACRYINSHGSKLWLSKAGAWAPRILSWGPDLIPQPGMLVRVQAWKQVRGVDESLSMAFDLDLLLKLKKLGPLIDTKTTVASFRWHESSLTASDRTRNLHESEMVKRRHLSSTQMKLKWLWEGPVRFATRLAAREVQRRAKAVST